MSSQCREFRVFPTKVLGMHGEDLSRDLETLPARLYEALQRAAAAVGTIEFIYSFMRHDFDLPARLSHSPTPTWLIDAVYRVCLLPTARGRVFQLSGINQTIDDSLRVRFDDFPTPFVDYYLVPNATASGLILITGPKASGRTSTAVAVARFMATQRRLTAFISERSPLFIFDEEAEPYITQLIGDAGARETLVALEHCAGEGRIVCVDNPVSRGLSAEALMLATRGFLVIATLEEGERMPTADAIEVFCAAAGHEYNPVEATVARALVGVLQCDPTLRVGLERPLRWHPATHEVRKHVSARDFFSVNETLNAQASVLDLIETRASNVTRLRTQA